MPSDEEKQHLESVVLALKEQQLITDVGPPIKSGKEASVYRCLGASATWSGALALKVFADLDQRAFRNDAIYWQGSRELRTGDGNTREARALRKGSRFGRRYAAQAWVEHEWWVLNRLWEKGIPVPRPIQLADGAILMELFATPSGDPAPPLYASKFSTVEATSLFESLSGDVEAMLRLDLVHGDLSPYNVLWNGEDYRIIDFPQTVDARFNPHARELLLRDLTGLGDFFDGFGAGTNATGIAETFWAEYQLLL